MRRRQFLSLVASGLGAGALGWWLWNPRQRPEIPGRIVGASAAAGHRLRRGDFPAPTARRRTSVVILGAGVSGLSAAWKLAGSGLDDFLVLELEAEPGGNSRSGHYGPSACPWGAHYLPVPTREARATRQLLEEMGCLRLGPDGEPRYDETQLCHDPQERLFLHGRWQEGLFPALGASEEDFAQLRAFQNHVQRWRERRDSRGRKAFAIPLDLSSPEWSCLDSLSMAEYLDRQGWNSPRLRWYVEYGCRDDYGTTLATTSAWAGLHYFASRDGGGFSDPEALLTWPEGNARLVAALASRARGRVLGGALVFRVHIQDRGVEVDYLDLTTGQATRVSARRAVYALPVFTRPHLLGQERLAGFTWCPWAVANLVVRRTPTGEGAPLSWDNVIYDSPSLGYVVATHQSLASRTGPSVLTWYRSFPGPPARERQAMLERDWKGWRDLVLGDLARAHPDIADTVERLDVMLWGHAMVRPLPGLIWGAARQAARQPLGPLHFAHSDLSGLSIFEEAQYQGVRAAQEVLKALHHPFQDSL
ncbi:MAG TPA: FAD-dependent oxidoreductase [Candidatus Nitrosotenuis sp.]|jgi:monoamine oxidase|nr:FAD-dependent oxidoreductase [Candidatus Nitrosotenuis sp.]